MLGIIMGPKDKKEKRKEHLSWRSNSSGWDLNSQLHNSQFCGQVSVPTLGGQNPDFFFFMLGLSGLRKGGPMSFLDTGM